jgi:hypothetical protein
MCVYTHTTYIHVTYDTIPATCNLLSCNLAVTCLTRHVTLLYQLSTPNQSIKQIQHGQS